MVKVEAMSEKGYSVGDIQEFFKHSVKNLGPIERMQNMYRIRPKRAVVGETSRLQQMKPNRMQVDYLRKRTNRDLILKMRQGGVTTLSCIQATDSGVWEDSFQSAIMAHILPNVKGFLRIIKAAFNAYKADWGSLHEVTPIIDNVNELGIKETGSNIRVCTDAKGLTLDFLHISEACFVEDDRISEAVEAVPLTGQVIMESTPNIAAGMFYDMWSLRLKGEYCPYKDHFYPWWWHYPEEQDLEFLRAEDNFNYTDKEEVLIKAHNLTQKHILWRRMKIAEAGSDEAEFLRKYPEDPSTCFLYGSHSVFSIDALAHMFRSEKSPAFTGFLKSN